MDFAQKDRMKVVEREPSDGHERLLHATDQGTGLNALISIHSTARGPAAGGCRMFPYGSIDEAITDVERLSRGMTYKNAAADLPLGGGKSVIIGRPDRDKTPVLMRAFGDFVNALEGTYYTAEDVGISPHELAYAAERSDFVVGLKGGPFASGDPSPFTAQGVFNAMTVTWAHLTGIPNLSGVTVAVQGLGHVGMHLARRLHEVGADLIVSDLNSERVREAQTEFAAIAVAPSEIFVQQADIFAPCAMGAAINAETVPRLKVRAVVGAANNQLASDDMGQALKDRGILYAPDYVVNGGGIVNVAMEILQVTDARFRDERLAGLRESLDHILREAAATGGLPHHIADTYIEERLRFP